ncbi:TetR/AcrR family transcriptional regulator [Vallicoccus soli]|uniref:TetR/AcrR family transcriptional regulator n=1 Tax=Vallicoccus soli TaxID=2339232 RepID=UPI001C497FFB|nr:TetR/AcrR family transcriptional regulator [Vallicoccus soli]
MNERTAYHHGDLRNALVAAGVELARQGGPQAVVLREAARATGVSPTAAYRHFADREALVAAVAGRALGLMARRMQEEAGRTPRRRTRADRALERFRAVGRAYALFAEEEPGLFRTAFGGPSTGIDQDPYDQLVAALDELVAAGALPAARRDGAEVPAWAAVHGAAVLLEGPLAGLPAAERRACLERVLDTVVDGI